MMTSTVRELRNHYSKVLRWVGSGREVQVTRRGKIIAKLVPAASAAAAAPAKINWSQSAALLRRAWGRRLSAAESESILAESQG